MRRTITAGFTRKNDRILLSRAGFIAEWASPINISDLTGNKGGHGTVLNRSGIRRFQNRFQREDRPMTISTRIALGMSAAVLSLGLALAPAAFAQDKMGKDDGMKKDTMSKDSMKKDTMSKDGMKKDDGMKK